MRAAALAKVWFDYTLDRVDYKLDTSAWPEPFGPRRCRVRWRCRLASQRRQAAAANGRNAFAKTMGLARCWISGRVKAGA